MQTTTNEAGQVLVFGGGGARCLANIGALQALAEQGIGVRAITGTSVGPEIDAFVANGMSLPEFVALATTPDWKQMPQLFLPAAIRRIVVRQKGYGGSESDVGRPHS